MQELLGIVIVVAAIVATARRVDVRLALFLASLALGVVAGRPAVIVREFLATLSSDKFVVPICCAMGFAHVLRLTECDQHLVHLLVEPLRWVRPLLVPGAVVVGFLVNVPIISQTSTAVCLGSVIVPLMLASRISPATTGAALLLGSSLGGELLNPGAAELGAISKSTKVPVSTIVSRIFPFDLLHLAIATTTFWLLARRHERAYAEEAKAPGESGPAREAPEPAERANDVEPAAPPFRLRWDKAIVPLVPLALLFAVGPPLYLWEVPAEWLTNIEVAGDSDLFNSRLIGAAMLVGVVVAALTSPAKVGDSARAFFEGAGYAFTHIIALIVTATCFGKGVVLVGLAARLGQLTSAMPQLLMPLAGFLPWAFAFVSGSGMASTQSLFDFFDKAATAANVESVAVGVVVALGSAAGRTMSPVAAVTLMCSALSGVEPLVLVRRVALPLVVGMTVVVGVSAIVAR